MFDYYREDAEQMAAQALVTNKAKGNSARGVDQNTVLEIMPQHSATPLCITTTFYHDCQHIT